MPSLCTSGRHFLASFLAACFLFVALTGCAGDGGLTSPGPGPGPEPEPGEPPDGAAADDYVISSGQMRSVRELCEIAFSHVDLDMNDHRAPAESVPVSALAVGSGHSGHSLCPASVIPRRQQNWYPPRYPQSPRA